MKIANDVVFILGEQYHCQHLDECLSLNFMKSHKRSHSWPSRKPGLQSDFLKQSAQSETSGHGVCASAAPWH